MLTLALKLLWRDWRAGELTLLLASLVIAVGTVTTCTLFVDRLQRALVAESATFLAADRVIQSASPLDEALLNKAAQLGLRQAQTLTFFSMVFSAERAQFASVKAVDDNYPLRGKLIAGSTPFMRGTPQPGGPAPGELWMESRLYPSLDVALGDLVDVGVASFPLRRVLIKEPDRGGGFSNAGPRLLMHLSDVPATQVVQPGSRLTYRYLFAGDQAALSSYQSWAKPRLPKDARIFGVKEGAQSLGEALDRGERFLLLGSLLSVLLAGVAIALAAQRYSIRHYDHVAILKTLGATPKTVDAIYLAIFVLLGLAAALLGAALGYVLQLGVVRILSPYIPVALPAPSLRPLLLGLMTGFVCLLAFAAPPLLRLRSTEPVRVIRRDLGEPTLSQLATRACAALGTLALLWWYSEDLKLTLLLFSGALVALLVFYALALALLRTSRALGIQAGSVWRLALAGMQRRGQQNSLQILVFGLAIMLLLILYLLRTALIAEWQAQIPPQAPNHFAINISPQDVAPIQSLFAEQGIASQPLYPMIRGRITSVNGESTTARDARYGRYGDGIPRTSATRNLTWAQALPPDNRVIAGSWWSPAYAGEPQVSLEQDLAEHNRLKLGDTLVFDIEGRQVAATVSSIRTVAWDNMQPNFYIIFSPKALEDFPSTFMTSFYLSKERKRFLNQLLRAHPTMTVIEIDALIEQVQRIITQVTLAVELVLALILASGGLVLLASVQASMDERLKQHAILRTLGAPRRLILGSLAIEFCTLGLLAGLLATLGAEATLYTLKTQIFQLPYTPNPQVWLQAPLTALLLIGLLGTWATRKVVDAPPANILRDLT